MSDPAENRDVRGNTIKPHSVETESVNTEEINNISTPNGTTLEDVRDAYKQSRVVVLKPDTTYTGSSTLVLDPEEHSPDKDIYIYGQGATLDVGSAEVGIDIPTNGKDDYSPSINLFDMNVQGPGKDVSESVGIRLTDTFGHNIKRCGSTDFDIGYVIRNVDGYSENNTFEECGFGANTGFALKGANDTGGSGTKSIRSLTIKNVFGGVADNCYGIDIYPGASPYNGHLEHIDCFVNEGGATLRLAGNVQGLTCQAIVAEGSLDSDSDEGAAAVFFDNANLGQTKGFSLTGVFGIGSAQKYRGTPPTTLESLGNVKVEEGSYLNNAGSGETLFFGQDPKGMRGSPRNDLHATLVKNDSNGVGSEIALGGRVDFGASYALARLSGWKGADEVGGIEVWRDGDRLNYVTAYTGSGTEEWRAYEDGSMDLRKQDLSSITGYDGQMYRHDGSNSISADGGTASSPGYYVWSASDAEWKSIVQY